MDLALFPLDTQICFLHVASYGFTTQDVIYSWKRPNPVQFVENLFLPGGFELANYIDANCDVNTVTGRYSCLTVDMTFRRQLSYYFITIYIPTLMIVIVSWMSFWLDHKSAPARVALTVTTLLAMSTTTSSINNSLPPVAYTKAIDVWTNLCTIFVFLALLEYALVNYAARWVNNWISLLIKCTTRDYRADAKANAILLEPPLPIPKPVVEMEPQLENGKLPYMRDVYPRVSYSFCALEELRREWKHWMKVLCQMPFMMKRRSQYWYLVNGLIWDSLSYRTLWKISNDYF